MYPESFADKLFNASTILALYFLFDSLSEFNWAFKMAPQNKCTVSLKESMAKLEMDLANFCFRIN